MDLEQALKKIEELEGVIQVKDSELMTKDTEISTLKNTAKDQALNFKKLRDMTAEEKELLTEKEKELMARQEQFEEKLAEQATREAEFRTKQREELITKKAMELARGDQKIANEIKVHLSKFKDVENANLESELTPFFEMASKMVDIPKADPLNSAHNQGGIGATIETDTNFADTTEGKSLANAMGLSQAVDNSNNNQ